MVGRWWCGDWLVVGDIVANFYGNSDYTYNVHDDMNDD